MARKGMDRKVVSKTRAQRTLERGAVPNLWRNTLCQIPTIYGRLVYLSSLRDGNSGRYHHAGFATMFGEEEANRALCESHNQTFAEWLSCKTPRQRADLDLYISSLGDNRRQIVETWARIKPYRTLPPASAHKKEIDLYLAEIEALLELLKNEYGVAGPE